MQLAGPWGRPVVLLAATLLPAWPWLAQAAGAAGAPRPAWLTLLLVPLYAWACAALALRRPLSPAPALAMAAAAALPGQAGGAGLPRPGTAAPAVRCAPPAPPAAPVAVEPGPTPLPDPPPPSADAATAFAPAASAPAEGRHAAEEIGRRVLTASGLLYGCTQVVHGAQADTDTLGEEERCVQTLLAALGRALADADEHGDALLQAALDQAPDQAARAELAAVGQASRERVLHGQRLAEALEAAEHRRGLRLDALRHGLGLIDRRIDRVLRDAPSLMQLARRLAAAPDAAEAPAAGRPGPPPG